ncbi:hypothetical protein DMZ43_05570 [Meridianimaribacter sp. CL38]|nr:hypothetical protein DMZ43_05570 [Meridianimaribacter sp. CL38]
MIKAKAFMLLKCLVKKSMLQHHKFVVGRHFIAEPLLRVKLLINITFGIKIKIIYTFISWQNCQHNIDGG